MKPTESEALHSDRQSTENKDSHLHSLMMDKIRSGQKLEHLDEITPRYKEILGRLLAEQAVGELGGAYSFLPWIQQAPTLSEKVALATITRDETQHAHMIFQLLKEIGLDNSDLWRNVEWYGAEIFRFPTPSWSDIVAFQMLIDNYADCALGEQINCSWGPWCRAMAKIAQDEVFHVSHGATALQNLLSATQSKEQVQQTFNFWFRKVNALFDTTETPEALEYKLILTTPGQKRDLWYQQVQDIVRPLGLQLPPKNQTDPPMSAPSVVLMRAKNKLRKILLKLLA